MRKEARVSVYEYQWESARIIKKKMNQTREKYWSCWRQLQNRWAGGIYFETDISNRDSRCCRWARSDCYTIMFNWNSISKTYPPPPSFLSLSLTLFLSIIRIFALHFLCFRFFCFDFITDCCCGYLVTMSCLSHRPFCFLFISSCWMYVLTSKIPHRKKSNKFPYLKHFASEWYLYHWIR